MVLNVAWDCNVGCFCWFYCCFSFTMQPYRFHPKSKWWAVAVQLTEVTSCHWVRLYCQFYEHSTYLTSDAAKDWFVKFVAGWNFSSDSSVWRGRCIGSDLSVRLRLRYAWNMRTSVGRQSGCATTTTTTTTTRVLTLSIMDRRWGREEGG